MPLPTASPHLDAGRPAATQPGLLPGMPAVLNRADIYSADRAGNRCNYMAWGLVTLPGRDRELSVYASEALPQQFFEAGVTRHGRYPRR